ncbi:exopolysaccharide biosynthesis protein EpsF [Sphingomonas changnyeongensis]|uniref:Exopolysaccharide biosynthesis protein EpsF n=1 Tax=Sphingomonas changnyeongensis TaxID=2698679 RepID=A0A7Z2NVP9_9SPHN|nr:GNVR domain-containing protein [Sphingomonas changnyeongensis]QHL90124.1 exopolysaccharide biosynthesis protein EpsF [Sphingomonas changnyeongensis]
MSLIQFLRMLAARRSIIWATLIACFFTATAAAFLLPPRFEAKNRVLFDLTRPDPMTGQLLATNAVGNYIATQLKLITDIQTIGPVVDKLGWAADPAVQARFDAAGAPGGDIREWLAEQIIDQTEARFAETSNIIEIRYRGADPVSSQRIAEAIREAFLQQNRDSRQNNAQRGAATYAEQARNALAQLREAEEARTAYAKENGIVLQAGDVDLESAKLAALSAQSTAPVAAQMAAPPSPARMQLEGLKQQIAQAQQTLGPNHPTYQALLRQKESLEAEAARGGGGMIGGTSRAEIEASYQTQKARVLAQADKIDKLNQMQQDILVRREAYVKLAARAEELAGQAKLSVSNMEPLGNTSLPAKPAWPNKPLIMGGSVALGLVLGILLALLVELLARRVRSDEDLEYASGVPVLAIVGSRRATDGLAARLINFIDRKGADRRRALAEG